MKLCRERFSMGINWSAKYQDCNVDMISLREVTMLCTTLETLYLKRCLNVDQVSDKAMRCFAGESMKIIIFDISKIKQFVGKIFVA